MKDKNVTPQREKKLEKDMKLNSPRGDNEGKVARKH
jgi:hypothetical protein